MKRYSAIAIILLAIVVAAGFITSTADFLPHFRYRSVSEWSSEHIGCDLRMEAVDDSTYAVLAVGSKSRSRTLTPWFGDPSRMMRYDDFVRVPDTLAFLSNDRSGVFIIS